MVRQKERAQGGEAGVAQRWAGSTRRARVGSDKPNRRGNREKKQGNSRGRAAWGEGDAGGQRRHKGARRLAQRNAMPMTRIEPYQPPRPTIRELMEGRPAGADDRGNSPETVPGEAQQVVPQDRRQGRGQEARESARDTALAWGRAAKSTRSRRAAVRGRARDGWRGGGGREGKRGSRGE